MLERRAASSTKNRWSVGFLALLGLALTPPAHAENALDERAGVRRICSSGPDRALADATRRRGAARVAEASVLPNPALVAEHQQTLRGGSESETIIGLAVPLGIGGRRSLLQDVARLRRQQAELDAGATLFEAALDFREAYVAAAVAQARLDVLAEQQQVLEALSAVIRGLARAGEAAGYDLLRQETQANLHRRALESARADARAAAVMLETWTGTEPSSLRVALPGLAGGTQVQRAIGLAPTAPPARVRQLTVQSRASALEARAARRRWVPDLEVFAGYRRAALGSETGDGISLALSVPVTLFDHGQGEAAVAEAEQAVSRSAASSLQRQHRARLKAARARLRLLEAALPAVERAALDAVAVRDRARQLYAAGEAGITELLEAFGTAEEIRLAQIDLWNDVLLARLAAMRSAGSFFDPELDRECSAGDAGR